jgi:DsbC/DsbD-like thiol-disulfide interchange protein
MRGRLRRASRPQARPVKSKLVAGLACAVPALVAAGPAAASDARYMDVELVASTMKPRPGSTMLVGFRMTPRPGWHSYWANPGQSGIATTVKWTAPAGIRLGSLKHPAPTLLRSMGQVSYVHEGEHVLVSAVQVDRNLASGTPIPVRAELSWAACSEKLCVPMHDRFSLDLVTGSTSM